MGLFRRKPGGAIDPRPAIAEFWAWWSDYRAEVVAAMEEQRSDDLGRLLRAPVAEIDSRLIWEIGSSTVKRYGLVLTSAGEPALRPVAERWRLGAPDDPDVEFFSSRQRDPSVFQSTVLAIDGYDFAMSELVTGARVDSASHRVDVVVHHPLFPLVDYDHRLQVALLGLDAALGEADVQRWVGPIEVSADAPIDAISLPALGEVVDQLRPPGGGEWAAMEGRGPNGPVFAIVRRSASPYAYPLADTHLAVVLGYDSGGNGMPTEPSISHEIEALESQVAQALGGEGPHVVHVGHVTGGGQVVAHFYLDSLEIAPDVVKPVLDGWGHGRASMATSHDPRWEHVEPFMG